MKFLNLFAFVLFVPFLMCNATGRTTENFNKGWKFYLGDQSGIEAPAFNDADWRSLDLPHDWSIEGAFSKDNPAGIGGGALPGGIGWYRKSFNVHESDKDKLVFIEFDGIYRNSEVWINGHHLGKRPYGYISFRYELTPYLKYGDEKNLIAVKADNSKQPNSRWYSGSGIYRNVRLVTTEKIHVDHWGTFITTPSTSKVVIKTKIKNAFNDDQPVTLVTRITDHTGKNIAEGKAEATILKNSGYEFSQEIEIKEPHLWSVEDPYLYKALSSIEYKGKPVDTYETKFGIRYFNFDKDKGFSLNGKSVKIKGVCNHHDLGSLGAAINKRALQRQLEIMKDMGVNGIRTSHNPPAPELLDLCDEMGFIVMDEAFDMWKKKKTDFDYALDWDEWHKRDIQDMVLRDRNHPSVFMWSIGNEVMEQWDKNDTLGIFITKELTGLIKELDTTRPVTANCNDADPLNPIIRSDALDLIGFSYSHNAYEKFPETYPGKILIGSETTSSLNSRGEYDMPSDSVRRWPIRWDLPLTEGNPDNTCSSYDNCSAPWGSTHLETWRLVKKFDHVTGMYIWTGFDYLGEPTPYQWPSRSSYFGIVDLAGFPKDAYYMYKSEWTDEPVLHIFPHWNWNPGDSVDVWGYTNCDEVELFVNGESLGTHKKDNENINLVWKALFTPGILKAVGKLNGKEILTKEIKTAGVPEQINMEADRKIITADGSDLSFIAVKVVDKQGNLVPSADNLINFSVSGEGKLIAVDNGLETSLESFKANSRKAYNGLCLVVIQSNSKAGKIVISASSDNLKGHEIELEAK